MRNPGLRPFDPVSGSNRCVDAVFAQDGGRDDRHLLDAARSRSVPPAFPQFPTPDRGWLRAGHPGRLDEAMRSHPDVQLPQFGACGGRERRGALAIDLPGVSSPNRERLVLAPLERGAAEPTGPVLPGTRVQAGLAPKALDRELLLEVDQAGIAHERFAQRPVGGLRNVLADLACVSRPGETDATQLVDAHRSGGGLQNRHRIQVTGRQILRGGGRREKRACDQSRFPHGGCFGCWPSARRSPEYSAARRRAGASVSGRTATALH